MSRQTDLAIELEIDLAYENGEEEFRHVAEIESTVYRVVQEALTNVAKHASATSVEVRVSERSGDIEVTMRDDGDGFDPTVGGSGFGLLGMRERLVLVRGTLNVESTPGVGTTVRARIPSPADRRGMRWRPGSPPADRAAMMGAGS